MNVYFVTYTLRGQGGYVPEDPVAGGGYFADKHCHAFITAADDRLARAAVRAAFPGAKLIKAALAGSAVRRG